jgi:hypothetical protein
MKKLIVGLLASFLIATGLVAFSGTPATAACPYTACIATKTTVQNPASIRAKNKATFTITVRPARSGNKPVTGALVVTIKKVGGGFSKVIRTNYAGRAKKVATPKLFKVGTYRVTVKFNAPSNSIYKSAPAVTKTLRVRK